MVFVPLASQAAGGDGAASSSSADRDPFPTSARSARGTELCSVCLAATRTHALIPCGHRCLCAGCVNLAALDHTCPICRASVYDALRVWDP